MAFESPGRPCKGDRGAGGALLTWRPAECWVSRALWVLGGAPQVAVLLW